MAYIEQEKVISELKNLPEQERIEYMGIYDCIKSVPTADVVEVVRCKECKYREKMTYKYIWCAKHKVFMAMKSDDDYCSKGERKDRE